MKIRKKLILPASIIAAAWLIVGRDWIVDWGLMNEKAIAILTLIPAALVIWLIISVYPGFYACEKRIFRRILGLER